MAEERVLRAQPGRQQRFLSCPADIAIKGGAAGGGKTYALLLEPTYHYKIPGFSAVFFRRTYPQIMNPGGLWDESHNIYTLLGGKPLKGERKWTFPSGATVTFRHMEHDKDRFEYQGAQIALECWDQLEQFSETQFFYLLSRNRSTCGVKPYIRATCNPDPDSFVAEFIDWWIADDGYADLSREGRIRWMVRVGDELVWADSRAELVAQYPPPEYEPKSVTFIPSTIYDNPILLQKDPGYLANLMALPPVDRERLYGDPKRGGNWRIRPTAGTMFNRTWFERVGRAPDGGVECRYWDFAATEKESRGRDPDYTASVRMRYAEGYWWVIDCTADQIGQVEADRKMLRLAERDAEQCVATGTRHMVRFEQEPGASGKREASRLVKMLAGHDVRPEVVRGDKLVRAHGLSAQCADGNVKIVRGRWNERWLTHMHNQPETAKKDIMDASSGAFRALARFAVTRPKIEQSRLRPSWHGPIARVKAEWSRWR